MCPSPPYTIFPNAIATTHPTTTYCNGIITGTTNENNIPVKIALPSKASISLFNAFWHIYSVTIQVSTATTVKIKALIPKVYTAIANAGIKAITTSYITDSTVSAVLI